MSDSEINYIGWIRRFFFSVEFLDLWASGIETSFWGIKTKFAFCCVGFRDIIFRPDRLSVR